MSDPSGACRAAVHAGPGSRAHRACLLLSCAERAPQGLGTALAASALAQTDDTTAGPTGPGGDAPKGNITTLIAADGGADGGGGPTGATTPGGSSTAGAVDGAQHSSGSGGSDVGDGDASTENIAVVQLDGVGGDARGFFSYVMASPYNGTQCGFILHLFIMFVCTVMHWCMPLPNLLT